jgi:hypothetical protein
MRPSIPDEVRRFILTSVPSVPYLEAMLLLRAEPHLAWDAPTLSRRLYVAQGSAADVLRQLAEAGFAVFESETWRWQPAPEAAALVDELAAVYSENLMGVTELIHSRENRRAHQFADAFRLRRESGGKEE